MIISGVKNIPVMVIRNLNDSRNVTSQSVDRNPNIKLRTISLKDFHNYKRIIRIRIDNEFKYNIFILCKGVESEAFITIFSLLIFSPPPIDLTWQNLKNAKWYVGQVWARWDFHARF